MIKDILVTTGLSTVLSSILVKFIGYLFDKRKQKQSNLHSKSLQVDNFYRSLNGDKMTEVLDEWTKFLFDYNQPEQIRKMGEQDYVRNLIRNTFKFASANTVERLSNLQNYLYNNQKNGAFNPLVVLVLVAGVIVSLKKDFSDEYVEVNQLLKVTLTDYDVNKDQFNAIIKALKM
ncbi:hypothetical protein SAMN05421503_2462 [Terribacillus aidingensis]|uniref:Uncharacterized protein n=1 Tax=Terribacillus aidingensis TaxID=586416 RepID=A0A285NYI4_9BACI|nr:hypothetical protein [Terribacillus aidingensis]SNZ14540.1 hypothetical protein SAMN05421503_2462 [Terribacillus aidingensis]